MEFVNKELNPSLITAQIAKFYAKDSAFDSPSDEQYFCANRTLNFKAIFAALAGDWATESGAYTYTHYLNYYHKLLPIYVKSQQVVQSAEAASVSWNWHWLGSSAVRLQTILKPAHIEATTTLEQVLWLTALLENALANVFYTCSFGRTPPHLLRDLLCTAELEQVFDIEAIFYLRVLLGTPQSINLRNIAWHGFPKPHEMPTYYSATLLLIVHSLGCLLEQQSFQLKQRPQVDDFSEYLTKIGATQPSTSPTTAAELQQLLSSCSWLHTDYKLYWQCLFRHYKRQNYCQFVVLILPQIELLLRLIYANVNDYDVRAKLDEYYLTMDSIFECNVPAANNDNVNVSKPNKMLLGESALSQGALKYLYDLFIAPNGPRLRDKVSHGEVTMAAINSNDLCCILWHVSMQMLTANECAFPLARYESNFHVNCRAHQALTAAEMELQRFATKYLQNCTLFVGANEDFSTLHNLQGNIKIFQRHKKEAEVMHLVLKVARLLTQISVNYEESINERLKLQEQRELHSKRRRTLEKLMTVLPDIFAVLADNLKCLVCIFLRLQNGSLCCDDAKEFAKLLRFLKHTLKLNENMVKYAEKHSNEWIKALELCRKFAEVRTQLAN